MQIVQTFISDPGVKIPEYTAYSLQKLRENNPAYRITFISNTGHGFDNVFKKYDIDWVDQNTLDSFYLEAFRNLSDLERHGTPDTKYPSPPKFFHRALERIFMLQAFMALDWERDVFHTENDVLTYYPLDSFELHCSYLDNPSIYITPMGPKVSTFAFAFFHNSNAMKELCGQFLEYLWMGEAKFLELSGADMLNEMAMLKRAQEDLFIGEFDTYRKWEDMGFMFDPGSYGQFLGGTNNHDHGPGYAGDHHFIGAKINSGDVVPYWDCDLKKPFVEINEKKYPLFNLHIHSKNLKDFI
jgi:hypothetical protein